MKSILIRLGLLAIIISVLAGCGGKDGATGPAGSSAGTYAIPVGSNTVSPTAESIAAWKALAPQVTVTGVTIASPPVVSFTVKDAAGNAIVGLGNKSTSSSTGISSLTNMYFTLAKLVPVTGGPSKWVTYLVTKPVATGTTKAVVNGGVSWLGTYPTSDKEGTLVDKGDGSYQYTFFRDIKEAANIANLLDDTADSTGYSKKADLDLANLVYDASQTHRLGIVIGGAAPGTGSNNPTGSSTGAAPSVNMDSPANIVYDFRPDAGAISNTRDIVKIDSCTDCHKGKVLAHGSRKDPKFCVTCHTAQIIYSFNAGEAKSTPDGLTLTGGNIPNPTGSSAITQQNRAETAIVSGRAVGNFPNMVHKIHMGKGLVKTGYYFNADDAGKFNEVGFPQDQRNCTKCHDGAASDVNKKTANGNNWKNVPSRLACGACHDGVNFDTATGTSLVKPIVVGAWTHSDGTQSAGPQIDDSQCGTCHTPAKIAGYHIPVTPPDMNNILVGGTNGNTNAAWIASNTNNLPAGAIKVTYDIKSVSRNGSGNPVMKFKILQDGVAVPFNTFTQAGATPTAAELTGQEIWTGFAGAPSVYFVFAVPQDGIAVPTDFNGSASAYLRDLWNCNAATTVNGVVHTPCTGSKGKLDDPDSSGYYTATLTTVVIPDNAVMLTGGLGYTYSLKSTMPLTQINLTDPVTGYPPTKVSAGNVTTYKLDPNMPNWTGGLIVVAPDAQKVATVGCTNTGDATMCTADGKYIGRRAIVEDARCNKCHQELGLFTDESFHGGQRNDGSTCSWCHNPNRTSSGWGADSTNFIHGVHGASKRTKPFTWHAAKTTEGFWTLGYPGVLKNCESCHLPGTQNFSTSAQASALDRKQYRTVATGFYAASGVTVTNTYKVDPPSPAVGTACITGSTSKGTELTAFSVSPYVTKTAVATPAVTYGTGYSINVSTIDTYGCTPTGTLYTLPAATTSAAGIRNADTNTLVDSPITTVCFACHDSTLATTHMTSNGGSIYDARSAAVGVKTEQCMLCHGSGKVADIKAMHEK